MDSQSMSTRQTYVFLEMKDIMFKFLVLGDYNVGKSSIVRRYTKGKFTARYKTTIGVDFASRTILPEPGTRVTTQLWDIAGNERYKCMSRVYYKYAVGCMIVYDVTRPATLASAKKWLQDLREKVALDDGSDIPVVFLANKWDIEQHSRAAREDILKYCKRNNILDWFPTSAKNNTNIDEAILSLVDAALKYTKPIEKHIPDFIKIELVQKKKERPCC